MPPNTIMHGGVLPLDSLFSFTAKSKSRALPPPEFTQTLLLDSTRLLSGLLISHGNVQYAVATSGSKTVISRPAQSTDVAVIEWKDGWIETEGLRVNWREWIDRSQWISSRTHVFKRWGGNPAIKWEATNAKKQVLASLVIRRSILGTRIELTDAGVPYADALVLTSILATTHKEEWKWHAFLRVRSEEGNSSDATGLVSGGSIHETATPLPEKLPTYHEAPFTRPLGPILSPPTNPTSIDDGMSAPTDRPLKLTLASKHLLNGTWFEDGQPFVRVHTTGPRTIIHRFIYAGRDTEPPARVVSIINWAQGKVTVHGKHIELDSVFGKMRNSTFSRARRRPHVCTLSASTSHWTTISHASSASIYPDPNAYTRYECRGAPPQNRPLALLTHYLKRKDTNMEFTPEGHGVFIETLVGALVLIYGTTGEWKQVIGVGMNVGGEGPDFVLGEEMVSDLDGWAGPVELMRLRRQEEDESLT